MLKRLLAAWMFVTVAASVSAAADADYVVWAAMKNRATLTGPQATTVKREVERIWSEYGVRFVWHDRLPGAGETSAQRVVVIRLEEENFQRSVGVRVPNALGATLKVSGTFMQVVLVSPRAAAEKVRAVVSYSDAPALYEYLLARFIGRIIAHELGHLMLKTTRHSSQGLMRDSFSRRDVTSDAALDFRLDESERLALFHRPTETASIPDR